MVESMMRTVYPARSSGVEMASNPSGAVASMLEKEGKKKTTFFELRTCSSPLRPACRVQPAAGVHINFGNCGPHCVRRVLTAHGWGSYRKDVSGKLRNVGTHSGVCPGATSRK